MTNASIRSGIVTRLSKESGSVKHFTPSLSSWKRLGFAFLIASAVTPVALAQTKTDTDDSTKPAVENPITTTPSKLQKINDLTARYRFFERYTNDEEHITPGVIGTARVAIIDVTKESIDTPKGSPKRTETTRHSIFTERPTEINAVGNVLSVNRTYERFKVKPTDLFGTDGQSLDGLSVLVRHRLAEFPQVFSLVDGRSLTEFEYDAVARQMFIPQVSMLVPGKILRIGDTWSISRRPTQALLADPTIPGEGLTGKLTEVRKEVDGPHQVATIEISGKLPTPMGESTINAELLFTFIGESSLKGFSEKSSFLPKPTGDVIEGRGMITEIRLARVINGPLPGPGRLRYQLNREVTMHRQIGRVAGAPDPPKLKMLPEPSVANSWLTYIDPTNKFSIQHPQTLLPPERSLAIPESKILYLIRTLREGRDMLQVELFPKLLDPEDLQKELESKYQPFKADLIKGNEIWLPEIEWPKMRVHRIDAEIKIPAPKTTPSVPATRIHFDGYLILFGQSSSIIAISSTTRDSVAPFRKEIEQVLKTITLDPVRPILDGADIR